MLVPVAYFGISSSGVNLFINLLLLFVAIVWLALVYWTRADAKRRLDDPLLVVCATAASLFPFVGTLIYMIVRPPEYLEDIRERELEMQAARGAHRRGLGTRLSLLPRGDREGLPALPELSEPSARPVPALPASPRSDLEHLSLL